MTNRQDKRPPKLEPCKAFCDFCGMAVLVMTFMLLLAAPGLAGIGAILAMWWGGGK